LYINSWKIHQKLSEFTPISVEIKGKIFPPPGSHSVNEQLKGVFVVQAAMQCLCGLHVCLVFLCRFPHVVMDNPQVFQGNPYLYPQKLISVGMGMGSIAQMPAADKAMMIKK